MVSKRTVFSPDTSAVNASPRAPRLPVKPPIWISSVGTEAGSRTVAVARRIGTGHSVPVTFQYSSSCAPKPASVWSNWRMTFSAR